MLEKGLIPLERERAWKIFDLNENTDFCQK